MLGRAKTECKAFKIERKVHRYPKKFKHAWDTDTIESVIKTHQVVTRGRFTVFRR